MTRTAALLTIVLALALAAPAAGHSGGAARHHPVTGASVKLRGCFLTAAFVPRPASPVDFGMPFYGPDPLVGVWAMACDRSRVAGDPAGRLVLSLVGVPVGLTSPGAVPLANNFAHRLLRIQTSSRHVAGAARRAGLPAAVVPASRYRHSPRRRLPSSGRLVVPGSHSVVVSATLPDPTNPHDHVNVFEYRGGAALGMTIDDAFDRYCLTPGQGCSASLRASRGSALARLLGSRSVPVRAAFDHAKIARIDIVLGKLAAARRAASSR